MGISKLSLKVEAMLRKTCEGSIESVERGDTFRLDHRIRLLRVKEGQIWLSWDGDDFTLDTGEEMMFPAGTDDAVISVVDGEAAEFELLCMPKTTVQG